MTDSPRRDAVDRAVADHYASKSLDAQTLASLRAQIDAATPESARPAGKAAPDREPAHNAVRLRTRLMAGIVGLAVMAVAMLAWPSPAITGDALAHEIASSHVMHLDPDIQAHSFEEARQQLEKLDFAAIRPNPEVMPDFRMTGARYTRVGGEMGAQFQIEDAAGRPCSLFQVRDDEAFRHVRDATYEVDGVRVKVWREAGLLMGLAETAS
jgi:hypothetical protein